ncbi:MAG: tRNA (adenosine(37)-N6)-threonylcarbamoyltransferase complex transferase subunit TsaD [Candidatus Yanofskybacteria bacterium CG10_big_fil_rev_8_21_14_0_10_46_23]|uniref:tRNA N6-adenosine threonylcarbamoyltransferase n=1 Tax=Candidatus Yanofskybacteria bacterium CG10_big_fil_rev_8_21_14_0_10_46_23 TaxID=1975098 RepID=A0A2H0R3J4_9BACT|nr:MAG: tRNA (adenosine(37)-N6)-threonylcarbamoyltransferase complex transferase subunit TsaD [Candidatus Yanofskybacteria bacterium CG10_big_fil_rev_8_21_14_0_10_46_23]
MHILGIETSCDDTAIAVVEVSGNITTVKSNVISSQIKIHAQFGGVVPLLAAREHSTNIDKVLVQALKEAQIKLDKIELIAVTTGPGLAPALLVGLSFAKALAWKYKLPLVGTNHIKGHLYSCWLPPLGEKKAFKIVTSRSIFPALALIVSGGHTELILMNDYEHFELIGKTVDDAAGEAFDKIARILDLGFPGGPAIAQQADGFIPTAGQKSLQLPRPMLNSGDFNFSFSGLKTAVLYRVRDLVKAEGVLSPYRISQIANETQEAIVDVLVKKTLAAAEKYSAQSILIAGGVAANTHLRKTLAEKTRENGTPFFQPEKTYTTDNGAMIALAGYFQNQYDLKPKSPLEDIDIQPNLTIY